MSPKRILIVGAGEAGRMLLREINARAADLYAVVGFLDDSSELERGTVDTVPVVGRCADLVDIARSVMADEVIIAVPSAGRDFVRAMVSLCRDAGVPYRIVPGLLEIVKGPVRLDHIRDVRPDDLLGRESVEFDERAIGAFLRDNTVLVTGAGGSIGGEICRQVGRFGLSRLVLLGRGENQIYEIEAQLRAAFPKLRTESVIADIRDAGALERAFHRFRPDTVYHAAAHKHVHYMESYPDEAVKNNVFGTYNVIRAAETSGVRRVVMLSTDKAVNPCGVMGATKRVAEYLMMTSVPVGREPRLITVRFGNVLASRGSVVPLFIRQIQAGGPVTVSDRDASRFFMSIKEACMLVVQASMMGQGGEIFILRMGDPIRIVELARDLIALHGLRPDVDVNIEFTGLRPGEKLHEDLVARGEQTMPSAHEHILTSRSTPPAGFDPARVVSTLERLAESGDGDSIRRCLNELIPEAGIGIASAK